jgi:hypothetical protein
VYKSLIPDFDAIWSSGSGDIHTPRFSTPNFTPLISPSKLDISLLFFTHTIAPGTSTAVPIFRNFHPLLGAVHNLCSTCQIVNFDFPPPHISTTTHPFRLKLRTPVRIITTTPRLNFQANPSSRSSTTTRFLNSQS